MHTLQLDLDNKKQVDDFLHLPFSVYRDVPQWVPLALQWERMDSTPRGFRFTNSPRLPSSSLTKELARSGRPAVLDNRRYNEFNKTKTAFFYLFECDQNLDAATRYSPVRSVEALAPGSQDHRSQGSTLWMGLVCWWKASSIVLPLACLTTPPIMWTLSKHKDL
jgi:hypothetical protein